MQSPLVSILIPFKNTEEFLAECLESVCAQDYDNWEIWAINDHSTDTSLKIADDFAQKDSRINIRTNTGQGIIEALRLAYTHSKGELVTRMDSDDIMPPNKLSLMTSSLVAQGKGYLAVGLVAYFSERGINDGYRKYETWLNELTATGSNFNEIYKECVIPSPCWMAYSEDLDTCSAFEPDRYPEDYDLAFRFYEQKLKCIPCTQVLHHWRDYDTRTSRTSAHYAQNYFLDIKLHYFLKLDFDPIRPLVLWGSGKKGKILAKKLVEHDVDFYWLCDNPNKTGKSIYGITMRHFTFLEKLKKPQSIIAVANTEEQSKIKAYFSELGQIRMGNYFFFC